MHILTIDGEQNRFNDLKKCLSKRRHSIDSVSRSKAPVALERQSYDGILLMEDEGSMQTLQALRNELNCKIPLITLSRDRKQAGLVDYLNNGADDYMTAPFEVSELLARLRAKLRYRSSWDRKRIELSPSVIIDMQSHCIERAGIRHSLTSQEYCVLDLLVRRRGRIVRTESFLREMKNQPNRGKVFNANQLAVAICRLRKKLGGRGIYPVRGAGYILHHESWKPDERMHS